MLPHKHEQSVLCRAILVMPAPHQNLPVCRLPPYHPMQAAAAARNEHLRVEAFHLLAAALKVGCRKLFSN